ncbi:zinc-finger domain-containing protein [Zavarzinia sp. CC-PAN008]|uniref:zinc-finger domain-containing protein n=1 Tax=Zavarzinia sp. CC-PAN008 TaxID=3243332 RepID=UPI003F7435C6
MSSPHNPQSDLARADAPQPPEVIEVEDLIVSCDGGGGALGHPRVYLKLEHGRVECGYCDRQFVLKPGAKPHGGH